MNMYVYFIVLLLISYIVPLIVENYFKEYIEKKIYLFLVNYIKIKNGY